MDSRGYYGDIRRYMNMGYAIHGKEEKIKIIFRVTIDQSDRTYQYIVSIDIDTRT